MIRALASSLALRLPRRAAPPASPPAAPPQPPRKRASSTRPTRVSPKPPASHLPGRAAAEPLPTPAQLRATCRVGRATGQRLEEQRDELRALVEGRDPRLLVVVGPCSVHDPRAARRYAERLAPLARRFVDDLVVVMRVYVEKPRSTVGWKGLLNDPDLDGSCNLPRGLALSRELMCAVAELGLPVATELLDPGVSPYFSDLLCWAAVGARTSESQPHRELASDLPFPVGFKNGTDGGLEGALAGLLAARASHTRLAPDDDARLAVRRSGGNPHGHLTLRGGASGPNYEASHVERAARRCAERNLPTRVLIDCSHGNSGKDHRRQAAALAAVAQQVRGGSPWPLGVMLESHLVAGRQELADPASLRYGQSITDACIDLAETESLLATLARARG